MKSKYSVKLKALVEELGLEIIHKASDYDSAKISTAEVNRPALQLAGFYNYFDPHRIQIVGKVEDAYLSTISEKEKTQSMARFMQYDLAAIVLCHGVEASRICLDMAEKYDKNVFLSREDTSAFQARLISSLNKHLAPRITTHGVLVDVYGEGVLLTGDSGIGKSETALELIKRGHRLIADDAVEIKRVDNDRLIGSAPEMIRYYMELRGIGVINVRHIYGVGAVKPATAIDLVVHMEPWVEGKAYDRLGLGEETEEILGVIRPRVTIPVRPGRNLAVIMELAAMNNRQKKTGFNAAEMLANAHDAAIDSGIF